MDEEPVLSTPLRIRPKRVVFLSVGSMYDPETIKKMIAAMPKIGTKEDRARGDKPNNYLSLDNNPPYREFTTKNKRRKQW